MCHIGVAPTCAWAAFATLAPRNSETSTSACGAVMPRPPRPRSPVHPCTRAVAKPSTQNP
eukprot:365449-Chlamydomonas_euryale.AAC.9